MKRPFGAAVLALSLTLACFGIASASAASASAAAAAAPAATVTLTGHVRDTTGNGLAGILVGAGLPGDTTSSHWDETHTDKNGRYELKVAPGAEFMIFNSGKTARQYLTLQKTSFSTKPGRTYRIDRELPLKSIISGTITYDSGKLLDGEAIAYDAKTGKKTDFRVQTGDGSRYELALPPGSYKVRLSLRQSGVAEWYGGAASKAASPTLTVKEGETLPNISATLPDQ